MYKDQEDCDVLLETDVLEQHVGSTPKISEMMTRCLM